MMGAPITVNGTQLEPGAPEALFQTHIAGGADPGTGQNYDISRDGRFLINTVPEDATASPITILQNWKPPAK
jgi:hypothetical protein